MASDTEARERSASPARDLKPKKKSSGFKWKDKPRRPRDEDSARLERGYRDRSPRRDDRRERKDDGGRDDGRSPRRRERGTDSHIPGQDQEGQEEKPAQKKEKGDKKKDKKVKQQQQEPMSVSNEAMIIVTVNDRLGTKAQIPCLASDSVKAFKAMVAAHIGRQPHEIMLKRQGERPFKDVLSLEDYGVSNGVQLDLELDTGD